MLCEWRQMAPTKTYINMTNNTQALVQEHAVFLSMFDHIEQLLASAQSVPDVKSLAAVVKDLLQGHGKTERQLADLALQNALADREPLHHLYADNQVIDEHFARVHRATDPAEALRLFHQALTATRAHFHREESHAFPVLEKSAPPDTAWIIGNQWLERHSATG
jgi:hypothetical protein